MLPSAAWDEIVLGGVTDEWIETSPRRRTLLAGSPATVLSTDETV